MENEQDKKNLPLIGITGGIASGKSRVSAYLRDQGFYVIDADKLGHRVLDPHQRSYKQIVDVFGSRILDDDGAINRKRLGHIVFNDHQKLSQLNQISHPVVWEMILAEIAEFASHSREGLVFVEAALLIEAGLHSCCRQVWVVAATPEAAIARMKKRNQFTEAEAQARLNAQLSNEERQTYADVWIENNGTLPSLYQQLEMLLSQMDF
ncbi:MAG: dephospho-CoA kinase [SAR324 cluster bacterium]|nr:dephospho-CoA kinase [SAR324 cluster bacterium]